jgi:hypothetical protein
MGQLVMDAISSASIHSEQSNQDDARAALETSILRDDLDRLEAIPQWISHNENPTEALTKMNSAHVVPLAPLLKSGYWQITPEEEDLQMRSEVKAVKGYMPRPRQGYLAEVLYCIPEEDRSDHGYGDMVTKNTDRRRNNDDIEAFPIQSATFSTTVDELNSNSSPNLYKADWIGDNTEN